MIHKGGRLSLSVALSLSLSLSLGACLLLCLCFVFVWLLGRVWAYLSDFDGTSILSEFTLEQKEQNGLSCVCVRLCECV